MYKDKIGIPDSCYKIVVILDQGQGIADINESTEIIACMFPNNDKDVENHPWTDYKTSIDHIEQCTGFDFLSSLLKPLQDELEGRPTDVKETQSSGTLLYPNPANDYVNIPIDHYEVYNSFGMKISSSTEKIFNTSALPAGVYFVRTEGCLLKFVK